MSELKPQRPVVMLLSLLMGWLLLLLPLGLLGFYYADLPSEIPLLRDLGHLHRVLAPKSWLTVFRVPLIGILSALSAIVMLWQARSAQLTSERWQLENFWLSLFMTASLKTLFEGLELLARLSPEALKRFEAQQVWGSLPAESFRQISLWVVTLGIILLTAQLKALWPCFKKPETWRFGWLEQVLLSLIVLAYLALTIVPLLGPWV